jgi:hypothetical protein|tara:strand:+ start:107 stop:421 length:315 start_codon:yes stop_codon:yes gene_type:complete
MFHQREAFKVVFKYNNKAFLGMLIFLYLFSVSICSSDLIGANESAENDQTPHAHCGVGLKTDALLENQISSCLDLSSHWRLFADITEPHLPILSFSIFKIPKPV